jgi:hypothetical protein
MFYCLCTWGCCSLCVARGVFKDVLHICHVILSILRSLIGVLVWVLLYANHCRLWLTVKYLICGLVQDNNAGGWGGPRAPVPSNSLRHPASIL